METKLCDILVYNRSMEEFNNYWDRKYEKLLSPLYSGEELKEKIELCKEGNRPATNWMYQNVIGYISILKHGYSLFATLSIDIRKKKYIEGRPDIRYDPSTFFSVYVKRGMSSKQIITEFNELLNRSIKERLHRRYVDLEAWNNISPWIDWQELFYPKNDEQEECTKSKEEIIKQRYMSLWDGIEMPPDIEF